jgi:hypothetical protein
MNSNTSRPVDLRALASAAVLALLAVLVFAAGAEAAHKGRKATKPWNKPNVAVAYEGTTKSGHKITFTLKKNELWDMESGIAVSCIAIQGKGAPTGGVETFSYLGAVPVSSEPQEFSFEKQPAVWWKEVTVKHTLTSKINRKNGTITGTQRMQFEYLQPTFPIPTFVIYSCLAEGSFKARPVLKK